MDLEIPTRRRRSIEHTTHPYFTSSSYSPHDHHDKLEFIPSGTLGFRHPSTLRLMSHHDEDDDGDEDGESITTSSSASKSGVMSWDASTLESRSVDFFLQNPTIVQKKSRERNDDTNGDGFHHHPDLPRSQRRPQVQSHDEYVNDHQYDLKPPSRRDILSTMPNTPDEVVEHGLVHPQPSHESHTIDTTPHNNNNAIDERSYQTETASKPGQQNPDLSEAEVELLIQIQQVLMAHAQQQRRGRRPSVVSSTSPGRIRTYSNDDNDGYDVDGGRLIPSSQHKTAAGTTAQGQRPTLPPRPQAYPEDAEWGTMTRVMQSLRSLLGQDDATRSTVTQDDGTAWTMEDPHGTRSVLDSGVHFEEEAEQAAAERHLRRVTHAASSLGSRRSLWSGSLPSDREKSVKSLQSYLQHLQTMEGVEAVLSDFVQQQQKEHVRHDVGKSYRQSSKHEINANGYASEGRSAGTQTLSIRDATSIDSGVTMGLLPLRSSYPRRQQQEANQVTDNRAATTSPRLKLTDVFLWSDKENVDFKVTDSNGERRRSSLGEESYISSQHQRRAELMGETTTGTATMRSMELTESIPQIRRSSADYNAGMTALERALSRKGPKKLKVDPFGVTDHALAAGPSSTLVSSMPRRPSMMEGTDISSYQMPPAQHDHQIPSHSHRDFVQRQESLNELNHEGSVTGIERTSLWDQSVAGHQVDLFAVWPEVHRQMAYGAEQTYDSDADSEDPIFLEGSVASSEEDDANSTFPLMMQHTSSSLHTRQSGGGVKRFFKLAKRRLSRK